MKRREFVEKSARIGLLGTLAGATGIMIARRMGNPESCISNPFCSSCGKFTTCAVLAKNKEIDEEGSGK